MNITRPAWQLEFSVHVRELDEQHKRFFSLLAGLHDALAGEHRGGVAAADTISALREYAILHFSTEEKLMAKHHYPDFDEQKKEHDAFFDTLSEFGKMRSDEERTLEHRILEFMRGWLITHILNVDKKYMSFFNSNGVF
ncbi:MAG: hemerythrin family protein [Spirochaetes bacterium]|nr:hemerythrin family protein [Spirochaetota bacterium]